MLIGAASSAVTYLTNFPVPWAANGSEPLQSKFAPAPSHRGTVQLPYADQHEPANNPLTNVGSSSSGV